jgi:hypothetical protein
VVVLKMGAKPTTSMISLTVQYQEALVPIFRARKGSEIKA